MPAKTHGDSYSPEYRVWKLMHSRCRNPKDPAFKNYGRRGIKVCLRWKKYENFLADMGRRPSLDYTIERINNNIGYQKNNCRWATRAEQLRNRRNTVYVLYEGNKMPLVDAANVIGVSVNALRYRVQKGKKLDGAKHARN